MAGNPGPTKWIISKRGHIMGEGKQTFTPAQVMGRLRSGEDRPQNTGGVLCSKICLGSRGVAAKFRVSAPVIQPTTKQIHAFSLPQSEYGSPYLLKGPCFSISSPQSPSSPRKQPINETSL